ncbi:hypothetical protein [Streptomyces sp. NPDC101206]|uniref:hypothetical protein n=1 Tax=Streptomyces sp. NPDC101206 TaxID=3366128 RepID=UPI00382770BB
MTGPIPVRVERIPAGAVLDLGALTAHVVSDVIDALLDPASTELWDLLQQVANPPTQPEEGSTEPLDREELERQLVERASSRVPLYGPAVYRLADRLLEVARRHVPRPRGERGAA